MMNVIVAPLVTQIVRKGTRGAEFSIANYLYTAITNSATYFANFDMISFGNSGIQFSIIQSLFKGIYKGLWKIL